MVTEGPDELVRLQDLGPEAEEIIERITPPKYREPNQQPDPQAEHQRLIQLDNACQAMQKRIDEMTQFIETEQAKQQAQVEVAKINSYTQLEKARIDTEGKAAIEQLKGRLDQMAILLDNMHESYLQREKFAHQVGVEAVHHASAIAQEQHRQDHQDQVAETVAATAPETPNGLPASGA